MRVPLFWVPRPRWLMLTKTKAARVRMRRGTVVIATGIIIGAILSAFRVDICHHQVAVACGSTTDQLGGDPLRQVVVSRSDWRVVRVGG